MSPLNLLISAPMLGDDAVALITDICPEVDITRVPYHEPEDIRAMRRSARGDELANYPVPPELAEALWHAEVIVSLDLPTNVVGLSPKLRWVQNIGAGIEQYSEGSATGVWESDVVLTNMGGFNSRAIGEYVLGMIIVFAKGLRGYVVNMQDHLWQRSRSTMISGQTVGIIGLGRIGSEVAKLCKAMDMRVLASKRTLSVSPPYVDHLFGADDLHEMLGQSDYVILALPSIPDTIKIIGVPEFQAMKSSAFFINVGRGVQVDEDAMAEALNEGEIAGAGLDVTETEPLSKDSPLWDLENVIITPHASASVVDYGYQVAKECAANLRRYIDGEPLHHVVDKLKGY